MKTVIILLIQVIFCTQALAQHDHNHPPASAKVNSARDSTNDLMETAVVSIHPGKTVVYHLYVTDTTVNFTGKTKHAYAINGSIPAPALTFTEGDTAEIYLHNMLNDKE